MNKSDVTWSRYQRSFMLSRTAPERLPSFLWPVLRTVISKGKSMKLDIDHLTLHEAVYLNARGPRLDRPLRSLL